MPEDDGPVIDNVLFLSPVDVAAVEERWPRPDRCDPDDPGTEFERVDVVDPADEPPIDAPENQQAVFGENGEFRVTVSGSESRPIEEYFATSQFCAEQIPVEEDLGEDVFRPTTETYLLQAVIDETQLGITDLQEAHSDLSDDATLDDLLVSLGISADDVVANALDAMASDDFPDDENAEDVMRQRIGEPGAPLLAAAERAPTDEELLAEMEADPQVLLVTLEYIGDPSSRFTVVGFAVDPPIGLWTRYYRAKCRTSARASLFTHDGRVRLRLYRRDPYATEGVAEASAGNGTGYLYGSTHPRYSTFDAKVTGLRSNSRYTIYDYWYEGSGGACD